MKATGADVGDDDDDSDDDDDGDDGDNSDAAGEVDNGDAGGEGDASVSLLNSWAAATPPPRQGGAHVKILCFRTLAAHFQPMTNPAAAPSSST